MSDKLYNSILLTLVCFQGTWVEIRTLVNTLQNVYPEVGIDRIDNWTRDAVEKLRISGGLGLIELCGDVVCLTENGKKEAAKTLLLALIGGTDDEPV
jgi:hypothetical protein